MGAIALSAKIAPLDLSGTVILRLTTDPSLSSDERRQTAFLLNGTDVKNEQIEDFQWIISIGKPHPRAVHLSDEYNYLASGDIVRLEPRQGNLRVLYRKISLHNVLFITERCNSRCVMCSQPPREIDDSYLIQELLAAIPMMSPQTIQLCITGGEPTLDFTRLLQVIRSVKDHLPQTSLHMLTNGRSFKDAQYAREMTSIEHPDFMVGIPLYSDQVSQHDFVVQSKGAFDETVLGLLNLASFQQKIEIRFVIHQLTVSRMVATAKFIARNFPFASHVALMGLEPTGFGRSNLDALWIDPWDYRNELAEAVDVLKDAGIRVSIYNHQLCILPSRLWNVASKSISDWKNIFVEECNLCVVRNKCAGFFSSNHTAYSRHIRAVRSES